MKLKTITLFILMVALTACGRGNEAAQIEQQLANEGVTVSQAEEPEQPQLPMMTTDLSEYPLQTPTDDILVLVNKTHPVTRDYVADDLVTVEHCDPSVGTADTKEMRKTAAEAIEKLIAGAAAWE